ncbi:acetyl-coenzyme A transporter 1 isoform X1 [Hydra vulgaris]|uniref:acetyl-coenzyme A transporter 1 isoform X1 n=1 Tax=Hydra vulgaris TaxID=6087 RepID=UPI000640FD12|nr:acetyl-coenzyme A transporter 1-like isoform X1 [Hydra vulgaris]
MRNRESLKNKENSEDNEYREKIHEENVSNQQGNLSGDYKNVFILFLLYLLQGIPLGMGGSIPMILQNKNISYKDQAMFSLVFWPFSLKLLWAPIVDALFFQKMGRRKSWLIPVQYLIGIFMLILSLNIDTILESELPNVIFLTVIFFLLNFLAATQDIVVDGWALTMLQKRNVGYGSTCNSVGQTAGYFLGNVILLAFSSPDFCNKYLRTIPQNQGIITIGGFLFVWGILFFIITSLVWIFKSEKEENDKEQDSIMGTYLKLFKIVKLPAVQQIVIVLLTVKVGFAATDAVTGLKLIEAGVSKETLSFLAVPLVPLQIILPLAISHFTAGPRPLDLFIKAIPFRLVMGLVFAALVYWTSTFSNTNTEGFPYYYYGIILFAYAMHQLFLYTMAVTMMTYTVKLSYSEHCIGGTYITFMNTMANLGTTLTKSLALYFVEELSLKICDGGIQTFIPLCLTNNMKKKCTNAGGKCVTQVDGYYVETAICTALGFLWLIWRRQSLKQLQSMKESAWKIK